MGVFAHATHFVLLPALAGLLLLLGAIRSKRPGAYLGAGALLGTAVLMKQHAALFLPLGIGLELWSERWRTPRDLRGLARRSGLLAAGAAIPLAMLCVVFAAQGVLGRFWFWTFQYAKEYVSEVPLSGRGLGCHGWNEISQANLPIWLFAAFGVAMLWLVRWTADVRVFLAGLFAASFLAICPGFYFREHYFILLLPAAGLFVGVAADSMERLFGRMCSRTTARILAVAVFAAVAGTYVANERQYLFSMTTRELSRERYGANPFVEAPEIARYIRENTGPEDRIAVLGSEPEIYFYANRKSATGHIYMYPLTEPQRCACEMQDEMISRSKRRTLSLPRLRRRQDVLDDPAGSDPKIGKWGERYTQTCYDLVGIVDIHSMNETTWRWGDNVPAHEPRSKNTVVLLQRKADQPRSGRGS